MIRTTRTSGPGAPRRGITMIEVLILVTCVTIVLGMAALTIQAMLRLVTDSHSRLTSSLVLERLARQLRSDAHASQTARLESAGPKAPPDRTILNLSPEPGLLVTYRVLEKSVDRDESLAGKTVRHESFALPRGRQASFELGAEAGHAMVSLLVKPGPGSSLAGSPHSLEVLAVVGKHRSGPIGKSEGTKK